MFYILGIAVLEHVFIHPGLYFAAYLHGLGGLSLQKREHGYQCVTLSQEIMEMLINRQI